MFVFCAYKPSIPTPPNVALLRGLMVSIRWYLGYLKGYLGGVLVGFRPVSTRVDIAQSLRRLRVRLRELGLQLPLSLGNSHLCNQP